MSTIVERANALAQAAKQREPAGRAPDRLDPARDWWNVLKPGEAEPIPVFFCPPQTQSDVRRIFYPGCGVLPRPL